MYSRELDTFVCVVEEGSFSKAARRLYLSVPSVIQQIDLLERRLGVVLLIRSKKGVALSPKGETLLPYIKKIIRIADDAKAKIRETPSELKVLTDLLHQPVIMQHRWQQVQKRFPNISVRFVSTEEYGIDAVEMVKMRTGNPDLDSFLSIIKTPVCIAVPEDHILSQKSRLDWEDLRKNAVILIKRGVSIEADAIRDHIMNHEPDIEIIEVPVYNFVSIATAKAEKALIILPEVWKSLCDGYVLKPCNWEYEMEYGFFYRHDIHPEQLRVLKAIAAGAAGTTHDKRHQ